ncbi:MAG: hypothetical protein ACE5G2_13570, partial [Candidatus Krumholzibacteriia bacterium]
SYQGRVAWYPLRYVGPILLEVNARGGPGARFPLFVEILFVDQHPPDTGWCDGPAGVVLTAHGTTDCNAWETAGPLDLSYWIDIGDPYVVRVNFILEARSWVSSPALGCIRVRPDSTTALETPTWSVVKGLYR